MNPTPADIAPHVEARAIADAARQTIAALEAGMPIASARRWPRYLAFKAARGERPISLVEAAAQVRFARYSHSLTRGMRAVRRT